MNRFALLSLLALSATSVACDNDVPADEKQDINSDIDRETDQADTGVVEDDEDISYL